jgi:UDP-N-acetylglucosamine--N-acetylmuramyl-(pentapeptide) pyrophosphoryl-undecaprenol N-acetylglucosamine transferase
MPEKDIRIIISGGGTGGHIYPAVAVAEELQKRIPGIDILFVGASDRMEMEKVPKAGYKIVGLWISGLQRSLSIKNLLFPVKVVSAVWRSLRILNRFKPHAAIGFGGYASGAMLYAATIKKIPSVIHEQNSYAGITNKILKNRVHTICVAYDHMERFFSASKIVKTGNPIRKDLIDVASRRDKAMQFFHLDPGKKTLLVIGGSLGARTLNQSMLNGLSRITGAGLQLIWQTGKNFDRSQLPEQYQNGDRVAINCQPFIYEMDLAYAAADIVVSRAGALSIAELAQVRKPVILVPSPNVAEDHQTKNAMALVEKEAAILVTDADATNNLVDEMISLAGDEERQTRLKSNIASFALPGAAEKIVDEVMKLINL